MKGVLLMVIMLVSISFVVAVDFDFENGERDGDTTTFDTSGGAPICVLPEEGGAGWRFINGTSTNVLATGGCFISEGLAENEITPSPNCCPGGFSCNRNTGNCEENIGEVISCGDFTTKTSCEGAVVGDIEQSIYDIFVEGLDDSGSFDETTDILDEELNFCESFDKYETSDQCVILGNCACTWEGTETVGVCKNYFESVDCNEIDNPNPEILSCETTIDQIEDQCDSGGYQILSWDGTVSDANGNELDDTNWCGDGERRFKCPSESTLPFFTLFNFVLSGMMIGLVYFFFRRK